MIQKSIAKEQGTRFRPQQGKKRRAARNMTRIFSRVPSIGGDEALLKEIYSLAAGIPDSKSKNKAQHNPGEVFLQYLWDVMVPLYLLAYNKNNTRRDAQRFLSNSGIRKLEDVSHVTAMMMIIYGAQNKAKMANHPVISDVMRVQNEVWDGAYMKGIPNDPRHRKDLWFNKTRGISRRDVLVHGVLKEAADRFFSIPNIDLKALRLDTQTGIDDVIRFVMTINRLSQGSSWRPGFARRVQKPAYRGPASNKAVKKPPTDRSTKPVKKDNVQARTARKLRITGRKPGLS